ncbi:HlyD family type I secretion periplasmic adaptor subunit [Janthinobacterium sp. LB2P49]|uniref:HlyD family type I secretion periplasmic adaptor subunit n=1 Tax=Janthinobacterium sp. LB2P49 TaxID=3424198 RepID=UPI003F26F1F9
MNNEMHEKKLKESEIVGANSIVKEDLLKIIRSKLHDPLSLMKEDEPSSNFRIVLWLVMLLVFLLILWSIFGKLDIVVVAEGKLVSKTLVKIVQPVETGILKEILFVEGEKVKKGDVLARLDPTIIQAEYLELSNDLANQNLQIRRIEAELAGKNLAYLPNENLERYTWVNNQFLSKVSAYKDNIALEEAIFKKLINERKAAIEQKNKIEQTLPIYSKISSAYEKLERDGYMGHLIAAEKMRETIEKSRDLDVQNSTISALDEGIESQVNKIKQIRSSYRNASENEIAEIRVKKNQIEANLKKNRFRNELLELKAPQSGVIKNLATTTIGAVIQPGSVMMTLIPDEEDLYADVEIMNNDIGFVKMGQNAQVKIIAYPFQKYGLLTGTVIRLSKDANENANSNRMLGQSSAESAAGDTGEIPSNSTSIYRARIALSDQRMSSTDGMGMEIKAGMRVIAEINQGHRRVYEYFISPIKKISLEAGRER